MPDWLILSLIVIFVIHFLVFAGMAVENREGYYWLLTTTFLLLVISLSIRLLFPAAKIGTHSTYMFPRVAAWVFTFLSIVLGIFRRRAARK